MNTSEIIGKKVLDSDINEIGKIQEIDIDTCSYNISKFLVINSGELGLKKITYEVSPDMIAQIGDYVLLKIPKSEIPSDKKEKVPDVEIVNPSELEEKSKK